MKFLRFLTGLMRWGGLFLAVAAPGGAFALDRMYGVDLRRYQPYSEFKQKLTRKPGVIFDSKPIRVVLIDRTQVDTATGENLYPFTSEDEAKSTYLLQTRTVWFVVAFAAPAGLAAFLLSFLLAAFTNRSSRRQSSPSDPPAEG